MGFFRRQRFKLPKFPPELVPMFKALCQPVLDEELEHLRAAIGEHVTQLRTTAAAGANVDVASAEELAETCYFLLEYYPCCAPEQRALIVGAVRYFAMADDSFDERAFASGCQDDKRVVNHVLERLGIDDHYLNED
jgi:hypothetical protein